MRSIRAPVCVIRVRAARRAPRSVRAPLRRTLAFCLRLSRRSGLRRRSSTDSRGGSGGGGASTGTHFDAPPLCRGDAGGALRHRLRGGTDASSCGTGCARSVGVHHGARYGRHSRRCGGGGGTTSAGHDRRRRGRRRGEGVLVAGRGEREHVRVGAVAVRREAGAVRESLGRRHSLYRAVENSGQAVARVNAVR